MTTSPDLGIPFIDQSQGTPEVTHNEALLLLQAVTNGVIDRGVNTPAVGPTIGDAYIIGSAPTGAWAGRANCVTIWSGTAWDFIPGETSAGTPITMGARQEGMRVWVRDEDAIYYWSGAAWTLFSATLADDSVTNAKLANMATQTFKGRTTAGTGDPEDLTIAQAKAMLNLTGTNSGDQTITLTGDVTGSGTGSFAATIAADAVTNAKLSNMATQTIKGRTTAGTGDPEDLTATQARTVLGLATTDSPTFLALTLTNGQLVFPATQVPSANANTLDDYEEGTWTPTLTFATPGDLSVVYSTQTGTYTKIGRLVILAFIVETSTFTHTTASGNLLVTGIPFTNGATTTMGTGAWRGVTKAGFTDISGQLAASAVSINFVASGSGVGYANVIAADAPSGSNPGFRGALSHNT